MHLRLAIVVRRVIVGRFFGVFVTVRFKNRIFLFRFFRCVM
jgi:hypothetical protein